MTYGDESVFTFDLNESLWFKRGQEVDEIMGISLEPEISIQEFDDFVSVRGVIELKGEYFQVKNELIEDEEQILSLRDHPSQRTVDRVESYEDGVNEFFHNFPVEVTIPKYRIDSLDDVLVGIDSFDYELPENSQLILHATIGIHGVKEDVPNRYESGVDDEEDDLPTQPLEDSFSFDVKDSEEEDSSEHLDLLNEEARPSLHDESEAEPEPELLSEVEKEPELEAESRPEPELEQESEPEAEPEPEAKTEPKAEKERWKHKKSQSLAEFFGSSVEKKIHAEEDAVESPGYESSESSFISFSSQASDDGDYDESVESREGKVETDYLINIFADKEEENNYSRLRIYIVQEEDTLDSIAERYHLSPMHISTTNKLESDDLAEGQILNIPIREKSK
ncbi:stage VI sporulation protein D [Aquibacillus koreensis]|uniref:Stage VI sporulation protein D n=1 Tax=Aquibacillus koreensis TaxID=279446 RepID=A0A9X3WL90_9BACI|nr:stage VI sporulation protein D [Aquibacillus koreensis]MCT2537933.1 stage VI sporulation protein D [Aquibacillus koreensis]MDC3419176.1 stage VI sporulation protein D [Aquibacillus koreensis]